MDTAKIILDVFICIMCVGAFITTCVNLWREK